MDHLYPSQEDNLDHFYPSSEGENWLSRTLKAQSLKSGGTLLAFVLFIVSTLFCMFISGCVSPIMIDMAP